MAGETEGGDEGVTSGLTNDKAVSRDTTADDKTVDDKTVDDKTVDDKTVDDSGLTGKDTKKEEVPEWQGAPEKYEDFKVPETLTVGENFLEDFHGIAKEFNLSQTGAQKLIDLQSKMADAQIEAWEKTKADWLVDAKKDDEIGGQKFDDKVEVGKRALKEFGTDALLEVLDAYGLGNHPEVIRLVSRVGEALGDDTITSGKSAGGGDKTLAQRMYPTHGA